MLKASYQPARLGNREEAGWGTAQERGSQEFQSCKDRFLSRSLHVAEGGHLLPS